MQYRWDLSSDASTARFCNTGLDSQDYEISVDWLRLFLPIPQGQHPLDLAEEIETVFKVKTEGLLEPFIQSWQQWLGRASAPGIQLWWKREEIAGHEFLLARLDISGKACQAVGQHELRSWVRDLDNRYELGCKRFDVAFDDYTKELWTWEDVIDARERGNYALARSAELRRSGRRGQQEAVTVYFGSRHSEVLHRFYNKELESKGLVPTHRCEAQFNDSKANVVFRSWLEADSDDVAFRTIFDALAGSVIFCDRSSGDTNIERLPTLEWWQRLLDLAHRPVRVPGKRPNLTIEKTADWLYRCKGSIVALKRWLGDTFESWLDMLIQDGYDAQTKRHDSLVYSALLQVT
ncbi:MAG: replication initiation factor domain-containing protein [Cyanobacteria bacterium P01_D01_bin.6]